MTTDPTITIAGLTAERDMLRSRLRDIAISVGAANEATCIGDASRARVAAERDALAAQLAEVRAELDRLRATDLTRDAAESTAADQLAILRADLASERAHLAACRTRIAGLEQAADERSRTPCNGSCDIALASRQVGPDGIVPRNARECAELWEREAARLWREETRPTARVAVRGAMELAAESFGGSDGAFTGAGFSAAIMSAAGLSGAVDGRLVRAILRGRSDVRDCGGGHYQIVRATTPPAPADVFAGVSEAELVRTYLDAERADGTSNVSPGIRAVLARLRVTLVKPVDPEVVAKAIQGDLHRQDPGGWTTFDDISDGGQAEMVDAVRAALTAAGVPVTPERK